MILMIAALALGVTSEPAVAAAPVTAKPEKQICKSQQKTGTRFPTKICRTAAHWEEVTEQTKREASEMVNRSPMARSGD